MILGAQEGLSLAETEASLWVPLPGPQTEAYFSGADELFYGGAAGGGKTDLLIGLALTKHVKSIIYRREYPQLKDVVNRGREILAGTSGHWSWHLNAFLHVPHNRTLELGAAQREDDVARYKGRAHDLKAFDEVSDFLESQYLFLCGWARTTRPGQRVRVACAGNPPTTAEGEWVIKRWAAWLDPQHPQPAKPGELRWYARVEGKDTEVESGAPFELKGETVTPLSRTFIPARLRDNPYLVATGYESQLQALPEPLRTQLLYGIFGLQRDDDTRQIIPTAWVRDSQARWAPSTDLVTHVGVDVARGGQDRTVIALRAGNTITALHKYSGTATPDGGTVAALVLRAIADIKGPVTINLDVIGVGSSAYDILRAAQDGKFHVHGINVAVSSRNKPASGIRFANLKADLWWQFRDLLNPQLGELQLRLPPDSELAAEVTAHRMKLGLHGMLVEDKEAVRSRLGRSPDKADAVVLTVHEPRELDLW